MIFFPKWRGGHLLGLDVGGHLLGFLDVITLRGVTLRGAVTLRGGCGCGGHLLAASFFAAFASDFWKRHLELKAVWALEEFWDGASLLGSSGGGGGSGGGGSGGGCDFTAAGLGATLACNLWEWVLVLEAIWGLEE